MFHTAMIVLRRAIGFFILTVVTVGWLPLLDIIQAGGIERAGFVQTIWHYNQNCGVIRDATTLYALGGTALPPCGPETVIDWVYIEFECIASTAILCVMACIYGLVRLLIQDNKDELLV